jgi:hypothetical protein
MIGPISNYSLESWVAVPPFSLVISLLLLLGCELIGFITIRAFGLTSPQETHVYRLQAIPVGTMILAIFLYSLALTQNTPLIFMQVAGWLVGLAGLVNGWLLVGRFGNPLNEVKARIFSAKGLNFELVLTSTIVITLFLIALGPVTNADALDYHMGVAIAILNNGGMPFMPEWFTSRLAGSGEVINALGLAVGAEQFGSLLQWGSLVSIAALVWPAREPARKRRSQSSYLVLLAALSTPVLLFLVSAPKPQLWPVALTTFAFYLFVNSDIELIETKTLKARFVLACMLCMSASQAKFNYMLGGGMAGCLAFIVMARQRRTLWALSATALTAMVIMLPPLIWKSVTANASIIEAFISPLPGHLPGTDTALAQYSNNPDFGSRLPFPISIFLPSSLGSVSAVLGISWLLIVQYRPGKGHIYRLGLASVLLTVVLSVLLAPPTARAYLEPYYWGLILCARAVNENRLVFPNVLARVVELQAAFFLVLCLIGVFTLFPGAISSQWRGSIMSRSANGFDLMRWVNDTLPQDAVLLNGHRSMALSPRRSFAYSWTQFVNPAIFDANMYLQEMKDVGITHVLITGSISSGTPLSGCFGNLYAGPEVGRISTRNPFNQGSTFDAWLFEFNSSQLPQCALAPKNSDLLNYSGETPQQESSDNG